MASKTNPYFYQVALRFLEEVSEPLKYSTYVNDRSMVNTLNRAFGDRRIGEITRRDIQVFTNALAKTHKPNTVRKIISRLYVILRWAEDENLLEESPRLVKTPKAKRTQQQWWTVEEMQKIVDTAFGTIKVLLALLTETGCRIGEALALQTKHIDFEAGTLTIKQSVYGGVVDSPKTDSSERMLCLTPTLLSLLHSETTPNPEAFVFRENNKPLNATQAEYRAKKVCKQADLAWKGFHAFRRGNITALITALSVPETVVARRVGHENEGMTLGVYVQKIDGMDKPWVDKIEKLLYTL